MGEKDFEKQEFIKDPTKKIGDLVKEVIAKTGENIKIGRVYRIALGQWTHKYCELFTKHTKEIIYKELSYKIVGLLFDLYKSIGGDYQEKYYQHGRYLISRRGYQLIS